MGEAEHGRRRKAVRAALNVKNALKISIPIIVFLPFLVSFVLQTSYLSDPAYDSCAGERQTLLQLRGGEVCVSQADYVWYQIARYLGPAFIAVGLLFAFIRSRGKSKNQD